MPLAHLWTALTAGAVHAAPAHRATSMRRASRPSALVDNSRDRYTTGPRLPPAAPSARRARRTQKRVAKTYAFAAGGLGVMAGTAHLVGHSALRMHPVAAPLCGMLGAAIGFAYSRAQAPNSVRQHATWGLSCMSAGVCLAPLSLLPPGLLVNAGIFTGALLVGLSAVAWMLPRQTCEALAGSVMAGVLAVVALALMQLVLPGQLGLSAVAGGLQLYGGFAVFSALFVTESKKVWTTAATEAVYSPAAQSVQMMLSTANLCADLTRMLDPRPSHAHPGRGGRHGFG